MALVRSLRARVVLWVSVALVVLFAATGVVLDVAFRNSMDQARHELLEVQVLGLMALVDDESGELALPTESLPAQTVDPQFGVANSGIYGAIFSDDGSAVWQSTSLLGRDFPIDYLTVAGEKRFERLDVPGFPPLESLLMGVTWQFPKDRSADYTFAVALSLDPYNERQAAFRRILIGWFLGITLTMLGVLSGLLTFVLLPLKRLERQVREVEAGERVKLTGRYPSEIIGLADNLNTLIDTERRRLARYRNTLDDLAHSLKTPLAAMRTLLADAGFSVIAESDSSASSGEWFTAMAARIAESGPPPVTFAAFLGSDFAQMARNQVANLTQDRIRTVTFVARERGIRQFLDIGTGLPTYDNTHQVAQKVAPESRIVYVDNDPLVLRHAHASNEAFGR